MATGTSVLVSTVSSGSLVSLAEATSSLSGGVVARCGIPAVAVGLLVGSAVAVALGTLGSSLSSPVVSGASGGGIRP